MTERIEEDPERALLGAALLDGERVVRLCVRSGVKRETFADETCRLVWDAMTALHREKKPMDAMTVWDATKRGGKEVSVRALHDMIDVCPTASHAEYYATVVCDRALGRELSETAMWMMRSVKDGQGSRHVYEELVKRLRGTEGRAYCGNEWVDLGAMAERAHEEWMQCHEERIVKKNHGFINGVPLPWECLNRLYTGVKPGLHIIAARPSQGKTAVAVNFSEFWDEIKMKHVVVSIDMPPEQMFKRYGCSGARTSLPKLDWGARVEEIEKTTKRMREVAARGYLMMTEVDHIDRLEASLSEAVHRHGARAAVVDYLQVVDGSDDKRRSQERRDEVGRVVRRLKALAAPRNLGIPIFVLCQLSRDVAKDGMKDENRMPTLTDLGDSGEIERAAQTVAMLHVDKPTMDAWELCPPIDLAYGFEYLAQRLRPLWYLLVKNQNGATMDTPFIMYPNYFMIRPGHYSAKKVEVEVPNSKRKVLRNYDFFSRVRDDWRVLEEDKHLERKGILGPRAFGEERE